MFYKVKSFSATGTSHLQESLPYQDYVNYYKDDHLLIGAVADGSGSCKYSHFGAEIAVEATINYIKDNLPSSTINSEEEARQLFRKVLDFVITKIKGYANESGYSVNDLSSTLLVFFVTPNSFAAMQIGDGLIVMRLKNSSYNLLFKPDKGEFTNHTTFITSKQAKDNMQVYYKSSIGISFICLATDWCEQIAVTKSENWQPKKGFFESLENCLITHKSQEKYKDLTPESLQKWLNEVEEVNNQKIEDDKTLLLCVNDDGGIPYIEDKSNPQEPMNGGQPMDSNQPPSISDSSSSISSGTVKHKDALNQRKDNTDDLIVNKRKGEIKNFRAKKRLRHEYSNLRKKILRIEKSEIQNCLKKLQLDNQGLRHQIRILLVFKFIYVVLSSSVIILLSYYSYYMSKPIIAFSWLGHEVQKGAIPIYKLNKPEGQSTNSLWESLTSQNISVWVLTPLTSMDKENSIVNVDKESKFKFYKKDSPPEKILEEGVLGYLPLGKYHYFESRNIVNTEDMEDYRWVKIIVQLQ